MLQLIDVTRRFGPRTAVDRVSISLDKAGFIGIIGRSGAGKSTLLRMVNRLTDADEGQILFRGTDVLTLKGAAIRTWQSQCAMIFQQFNLIPSLSAGANIAMQARLAGRNAPDWNDYLAQAMGLADLLDRYPEELSGGQQQRVAIARALAARPALVLADEPTGNLDEANADAVLTLMLDLVAEAGAGLLLVTHSPRQAARLGRQVRLVMGRVQT